MLQPRTYVKLAFAVQEPIGLLRDLYVPLKLEFCVILNKPSKLSRIAVRFTVMVEAFVIPLPVGELDVDGWQTGFH